MRTHSNRRSPRLSAATLTAVVAAVAVSAPAAAQTIAITGGTVYTVSGPPIENGTVLITNGRITAVGTNVTIPSGAQRIDAAGKWVTPGFVHAYSGLGVHEIGLMPETVDRAATGSDFIAASFPVWEGINPASAHITEARRFGITTVGVVPQGGLIAGQGAVIDLLHDRPVSEMLVKTPAAMAAQIGTAASTGLASRGEQIARLRELLADAKEYADRRTAFASGSTRQFAARQSDLEALQAVLSREVPLYVSADHKRDIEAVVRLSRDLGIRVVIVGGADAWMMADVLADAQVPVLTGAHSNLPFSFRALGKRRENAALLREAGVTVGIVGDYGTVDPGTYNAANIRYEAGSAVVAGLPWPEALRALTMSPAEILGIADRVGSIQPGLVANVVVWTGDPLEFASRAEHVFIRGQAVDVPSRREELMHRYRTLPPDYRKSP